MIRATMVGISAALLVACSSKPAAPPPIQEASAMQPGQWEVTSKVTALQLTDKAANAGVKVGDATTSTGCVAQDGTPDMKLFASKAKKCEPVQSYASNGRLSMQMNCTVEGKDSQLLPQVDATFTADTLEGTVNTAVYSATGQQQYSLSEAITGKRVGECTA
jgi:hypothetical protein